MEYAIIYTPGPAWIAGRPADQQALGAHNEYLKKLRAADTLLQVSYSSDGKTEVAVFEVKSQAEARQLLAMDPAVRTGILNAELRQWNIVFGLNAEASLPKPV
ncbi:MAG: hypothetical protein JO132_13940 [Streptosporangiaceae bacterium]|nr:hypothetical protein [Streptosporangiaceae bacterium]